MESSQPPAPSWSVRFAATDADPTSSQAADMLSRVFENHVRAGGGTQAEQAARARALLTELAKKHGSLPVPASAVEAEIKELEAWAKTQQSTTQTKAQPATQSKPQPATQSRAQHPTQSKAQQQPATQSRVQPTTQSRSQNPPAHTRTQNPPAQQQRKAPANPERTFPPPPYNPQPYDSDPDLINCSEYLEEMSERKADARRRAIVKAVVIAVLPDIVGIDRDAYNAALNGRPLQPEDFLDETSYTEDEDEEDYTEDEEEYDEEYDEESYDDEMEEDAPPEVPGVFERLKNELRNSEQYAAGKFNIQRWVDLTREAMQPPAAAPAPAPVAQRRARGAVEGQLAAAQAKRAPVEMKKAAPMPVPKAAPPKPSKAAPVAVTQKRAIPAEDDGEPAAPKPKRTAPATASQKRTRPTEDDREPAAPKAKRVAPTPAPAPALGRRQTRSATAAAAAAAATAAAVPTESATQAR
ncbi:hypothetical protein B0T11DRAFT_286974 [Plectosphaerella cucumerina]|uniref:Uncharacterized protein n=1 Tax=Plectosphaerella cucumerina TaxID=40658 RepID=A0A8K0T7Y4_9PEZI|nr:hypothetical protein B0T11DRAFT_286974 [Plectosphaerella cucumerina]